MKEERQREYENTYLKMAQELAKLSHCTRSKVGALIVKNRNIIADGYNGTPTGFENKCEVDPNTTKWYVVHAEANAILKLANSTQSCKDATLYVTHPPCRECSKMILQAGIKKVIYSNNYRDYSGISFLKEAGIEVLHISID